MSAGRPKGSRNKAEHGQGRVFQRPDREGRIKYGIRYVDALGRQRERIIGFDEGEARRELAHQVELRRQRRVAEVIGITMTEWVEGQWLPTKRNQVQAATYIGYERIWRCHLRPYFGGEPMHTIETADIARYLAWKQHGSPSGKSLPVEGGGAERLGAKSVREHYIVLRQVFAHALRYRKETGVTENPTLALDRKQELPKLPRLDEREVRALSEHEVERLLALVPSEHSVLVQLALAIGARVSELLALTWDDLDDKRRLHVRRAIKRAYPTDAKGQRTGRYREIGTTKTNKARTIVISDELYALLREHEARQAAAGGTNPKRLMFPNARGEHQWHSTLRSRIFDPAVNTMRLQELTASEREAVLGAAADDEQRLVLNLLSIAGAVLGSGDVRDCRGVGLLDAKWDDLDKRRQALTITDYDGQRVRLPLSRAQLRALAAHHKATGSRGNRDGYIFIGRRGQALSAYKLHKALDAALADAGCASDITFHSLRHTTATALIAAGASVPEVQHLLGHERPSTTTDIYTHAWKRREQTRSEDAFALLRRPTRLPERNDEAA